MRTRARRAVRRRSALSAYCTLAYDMQADVDTRTIKLDATKPDMHPDSTIDFDQPDFPLDRGLLAGEYQMVLEEDLSLIRAARCRCRARLGRAAA